MNTWLRCLSRPSTSPATSKHLFALHCLQKTNKEPPSRFRHYKYLFCWLVSCGEVGATCHVKDSSYYKGKEVKSDLCSFQPCLFCCSHQELCSHNIESIHHFKTKLYSHLLRKATGVLGSWQVLLNVPV